ncbi:MAG TPA: NAD-dependent epimerase/dehydratase family protein [Anaerolineae bacterium]|nr:NAD-dependent epimerase/dehydratase family protein [Anaerolineae bacterium]
MIDEKILGYFNGKNILITGGTGMIGRAVASKLKASGGNIRIASLDKIIINTDIEHIFGDLTDINFCKEISQDMDCVFHLAGIKGSIEVTKSKPASFFVPLIMMNTNILEASRLAGVKKVVYTSSIGAYNSAEVFVESSEIEQGPPMDMFPGWAKRMAELQINAYKIQYGIDTYAVVRPCNVYGPGDNFDPNNAMVIPTLMYRILNKEDPVKIWGDGSAIRDFLYSEDCAEGIIQALYHGTKSKYVNLGSGIGYSIKQLVETLKDFLDFNYEFDTSKPSGFPRRVMDISLARELIGYDPKTSLREGLEKTWGWFVTHQDEYKRRKNYFKEE